MYEKFKNEKEFKVSRLIAKNTRVLDVDVRWLFNEFSSKRKKYRS